MCAFAFVALFLHLTLVTLLRRYLVDLLSLDANVNTPDVLCAFAPPDVVEEWKVRRRASWLCCLRELTSR